MCIYIYEYIYIFHELDMIWTVCLKMGDTVPFFMADFFGGNGADLPNGPMLIYKSQNFRSLVGMMVTLW